MKTREEIQNEIQSIADGLNLSGQVINATINLLTNVKYTTLYETASLVLESSASRCVVLNSAITHARSLMYSVKRGINQKILIKNIQPTVSFKVNKFDVAHSLSGKYLLYAEDYEFIEGTSCDIEVIVTNKKPLVFSKEVTDLNKFCVDFLQPNISSSIEVKIDEIKKPHTTLFKDIIIEGTNKVMDLTGMDYSVSIVNSNGFEIGQIIKVTLVPFYDEELSTSAINQLPQFIFNSNTIVKTSQVIMKPESDVKSIWMNSVNTFESGFVARSNTDVAFLINQYFNSTKLTLEGINVVTSQNDIQVYYTIPKNGYALTEDEIEAFSNWLEKAYYINQPIHFQLASIYEPSDGSEESKITIQVAIEKDLDITIFNSIASSYCNSHIGKPFNAFELLAEFQKVDGVQYSSIIALSGNMSYLIELEADEYVSPESISIVI